MYKILIFNGYYIPSINYGGPQTSIENVVNACSDEFEFYIICNNHDFRSSIPFDVPIRRWVCVGRAHVMYIPNGDLNYSWKGFVALYMSLKPDLVWFSGVLVPKKKVIGTIVARKMKIPVLFSPRGELSADRVCIKGYKKIPYLFLLRYLGIYRNCFFHVTSQDERDGVNRFFHVDSGQIFDVPNISIMKQPSVVEHHKEKGRLKLFFLSRIHPVKNLLFAIKSLKTCKQSIEYDVFGPIEDLEYWKQCQSICSAYGSNIRVNYKGYMPRDMMTVTIQNYDALFFMTLNENYGHVIAESLANARPVIISKGTTPWDEINGRAGYAIPIDEPLKVAEVIDNLASLNKDEFDEIIQKTSDYFDNSPLINAAIDGHKSMFKVIIDNNKE